MRNRGNARDVAASPDISSKKRSEPTNQAQIKTKLRQFLERIKMKQKNIFTTFQVAVLCK